MVSRQPATTAPAGDQAVLLREDSGGIARLTLNRPAARNALSVALMAALQDALDAISADRAIKVVVIAANGPAFCAGHDLREMRANPGRAIYEKLFTQCANLMISIVKLPQPVIARVHGIYFKALMERCSALMLSIQKLPQPVIAAVEGVATAAGCQLVATCDLAVASETARFSTPGVHIGLFCSTPMVALSRAVSRKPAMEMLLTGEMISAQQARDWGLINRVVAPASLDAEVTKLAQQISSKSPLVVKIGKQAFYRQAELGLDVAYAYASEVMTTNMLARDAEEGIDAFLQKRPPVWENR